MSINVNYTEEELVNFLKDKLQINDEILQRIREEKIDGEALILLRKKDFNYLKIKVKDRDKILRNKEKNITKMKKNIHKDELYIKIINSTSTSPWDYLEMNESQLKLGGKLKFIKYTFIKNQPPDKENSDQLLLYLKNYLKLEHDIIKQITDNIKDLLTLEDKDFEDQCIEWNIIDDDEQFKLKLIIEIMKSNIDNKSGKHAKEHVLQTPVGNLLENIIKTGKKLKINLKKDKIDFSGEYNFYSLIELYNYETSQEDIARGLKNPINEFHRLCNDFGIEFKNEGTYINFNQAFKKEISTSMLWGTQESLTQFFSEHKINNAISYFSDKEIKNKAGIYLCINKDTFNAFLIIWPGELDYKYSKIEETNDNILLTLIRYGFSISSNSILCFTDDEIKELNFEGYELFREMDSVGYEAERSKIVINQIKQKSFEIGQKKLVELENLQFKNKIINKILNQNCLLVYEEREKNYSQEMNINNIEEFIKYNSEYDIYFDDDFEYINPPIFYYLISNNHIFLKNIENEKCYFSKRSLKDVFLTSNSLIFNLSNFLFFAIIFSAKFDI